MIKNRFTLLPLGSVKPEGFLLKQLSLQAKHLTKNMEEYPDYSANSGWLGGLGEHWERGPYYVRGLVAVAYVLDDSSLKKKVKKWIDYTLNHQQPNGNFFPNFDLLKSEKNADTAPVDSFKVENDWWAKMPMLFAIRDYYEAEKYLGNTDERVLPFFDRFFRFQLETLPSVPLSDWAKERGADNVEVALWLYEKDNLKYSYIIRLCELLFSQTTPWAERFKNTAVRHHVVNTTQAYKYPYLYYKLSGDESYLETLKKGLKKISNDHGRIDNLPNADESARDNLFTRGTESCAVVEAMLSMEINGFISGENYLFDLLEGYAYNNLPNCFNYDISAHTYFQLQNNVMCTFGNHGFDCDHGDSSAFGAPNGFDCCFANSHMGYPKYIQSMYGKTDDGYACLCYGASKLSVQNGSKKIIFEQFTDYPYDDTIKLKYSGDKAFFSLTLRIPLWSKEYRIFINGERFYENNDNGFVKITMQFAKGDIIELRLKSDITFNNWHNNSCYVKKGAVIYCLPVKEKWVKSDPSQYREIKELPKDIQPSYEIFPDGKFNYAICSNGMTYVKSTAPIQLNPLSECSYIEVKACEMPEWQIKGNVVMPFDESGTERGKITKIKLIPYSHTRLKISVFPKAYNLTAPCCGMKLETNLLSNAVLVLSFNNNVNAENYILKVYGKNKDRLIFIPKNQYKLKDGHTISEREKFAFSLLPDEDFVQLFAVKKDSAIDSSEKLAIQ